MKSNFFSLLLAVFTSSALLFGCKNDDDVTFDVTIPVDYVVDETAVSSIGKSIDIQGTLDALTSAQVTKYKDKIKNVYINSISYAISSVEPSGTINLSRIDVVLKGSLDPIVAETSSQLLATKADTEMTERNDYEFQKLSDQIKYNQQSQILIRTSVSKTPIKFTLTLKVSLKIVASS